MKRPKKKRPARRRQPAKSKLEKGRFLVEVEESRQNPRLELYTPVSYRIVGSKPWKAQSPAMAVDIASGKTFNTSRLVFFNAAKVKVTGGGTLVSSPHWDCGCPCDPELCDC